MILLNRFGGKIISRVRKRYFNASETFFNYPLALARDEIHSIARCPKYYRIFTIRSFPSVERFARDRFFFSFLYRCRNRNCQFFPLSPTEHTHTRRNCARGRRRRHRHRRRLLRNTFNAARVPTTYTDSPATDAADTRNYECIYIYTFPTLAEL